MIFTDKYNFGVSRDVFINTPIIGYLNLGKVKTSAGLTVGDATSLDTNVKIAIKKCYNEYLERFSMGLPVGKSITVNIINPLNKSIGKNLLSEFGYGTHCIGHNDTTGTASGKKSSIIIQKAVSELIEKNEVFCFWYGFAGKVLENNAYITNIINNMGFLSSEFFCFLVNEISNFPTVIVLGFKEKKIVTTGVACSNTIKRSIFKALQEAKIVEWQQYNNKNSNFSKYSSRDHNIFYNTVISKRDSLEKQKVFDMQPIQLEFSDWINDLQIKLLYSDKELGIKTIKCISKDLLSSLPTVTNISKSLNKKIVQKYYKNREVDCPIV